MLFVRDVLTVLGLWALPAVVTHLLAVAALYIVHVDGLITLSSTMTFLATVSAAAAATLRAVLGKMTGCIKLVEAM